MERRVTTRRVIGAKFVRGQADTGRLVLTREDGSTARCGVVIVQGATLTDNSDSTYDLSFDGS
jgi:hypothetical protein